MLGKHVIHTYSRNIYNLYQNDIIENDKFNFQHSYSSDTYYCIHVIDFTLGDRFIKLAYLGFLESYSI